MADPDKQPDPLASFDGRTFEVDGRRAAEAYLVALHAGWRPDCAPGDDPVLDKLAYLGLLSHEPEKAEKN